LGYSLSQLHLAGWVLLLSAIADVVFMSLEIDAKSHSVSDTWLNFAFNLIIINHVYSFIAFLRVGEGRKVFKWVDCLSSIHS